MNTFTLNGNTIVAKEFNFNTVCELDNYGVSMQDIGSKPMAFVRAYLAYCMNDSLEMAGQAINDHVVSGGNLDDIFSVINKEMESSGFFRAMDRGQEEVPAKATAGQRKAK